MLSNSFLEMALNYDEPFFPIKNRTFCGGEICAIHFFSYLLKLPVCGGGLMAKTVSEGALNCSGKVNGDLLHCV